MYLQTYHSTWHKIPEDLKPYQQRCEDLKYPTVEWS